jgi:hypothetical protein
MNLLARIVRQCIEQIEGNGGLTLANLYTTPGHLGVIRKLRSDYDSDSANYEGVELKNIAGLLKQTLVSMPEALLAVAAPQITDAISIGNLKNLMPPKQLEITALLFHHLFRIAGNAAFNNTNAQTLARVFSRILGCPQSTVALLVNNATLIPF